MQQSYESKWDKRWHFGFYNLACLHTCTPNPSKGEKNHPKATPSMQSVPARRGALLNGDRRRGNSQAGLTSPSGWPCPHGDAFAQLLNQDNQTYYSSLESQRLSFREKRALEALGPRPHGVFELQGEGVPQMKSIWGDRPGRPGDAEREGGVHGAVWSGEKLAFSGACWSA